MQTHNKDYTIIAEIYNHLMKKIDYRDWAKYIFDVVCEYHKKELDVLEIASGTGKLGTAFTNFTSDFVFTDLSSNMLKQINSDNPRICCNMTALPFKKKFNTVFSTFDSFNYILELDQLIQTFDEVEKILTEDGILTFDVSLELNSKKYLKHLNRKGKFKEFYYIQLSDYDEKNRIHYNKFVITKDNFEYKEEHKQRIYSVEELIEASEESNLKLLDVFEAFTFEDLHAKSLRAQFVLGKKNAHF